MVVLNTFSLSSIDPICIDLDDDEIIATMVGVIALVATYQQFQDDRNDVSGYDINENGHPGREKHCGSFFGVRGESSIICKQRMPLF